MEAKFKVGQEVKCIKPKGPRYYPVPLGSGWEERLVFKIDKIDLNARYGPIYWHGKDIFGVYEDALELYNPDAIESLRDTIEEEIYKLTKGGL